MLFGELRDDRTPEAETLDCLVCLTCFPVSQTKFGMGPGEMTLLFSIFRVGLG